MGDSIDWELKKMSGLVWMQVNESGGLRCWSSFRRACVALYYILHVADTAPAAARCSESLLTMSSSVSSCLRSSRLSTAFEDRWVAARSEVATLASQRLWLQA